MGSWSGLQLWLACLCFWVWLCCCWPVAALSSLQHRHQQHQHRQIQHQPSSRPLLVDNVMDNDNVIRSANPVMVSSSSRRAALTMAVSLTSLLLGEKPAFSLENDNNNNDDEEEESLPPIYQLISGVQFRDVRIGSGPIITASQQQQQRRQQRQEVVLHVQALLRDGTVLMDTRQFGSQQPIVYELGSAFLEPAMMNSGQWFSTRPPLLVTPGLDDALVSRGTTASGQRVEPMRQGGIRRVVVPAHLAYGNDGVSRYQLTQSNSILQQPVPRNELIRYEVEILRCLDIPIELPIDDDDNTTQESSVSRIFTTTVQACCSEDVYPCQTPSQVTQSQTQE